MSNSGVSIEQQLEAPQRTYTELSNALNEAAKSLVRYAALVGPVQNPAELLLTAQTTLQGCATSVIERINSEGKIREFSPTQLRRQEQERALWNSFMFLAGVRGLSRRQRRRLAQDQGGHQNGKTTVITVPSIGDLVTAR